MRQEASKSDSDPHFSRRALLAGAAALAAAFAAQAVPSPEPEAPVSTPSAAGSEKMEIDEHSWPGGY
jgi:hypothetical protein